MKTYEDHEEEKQMTTHPETIQVPDGWTLEDKALHLRQTEGCTGVVLYMKLEAKPLPPPEPPIKPCPFCGHRLQVWQAGATKWYWGHEIAVGGCAIYRSCTSYPTRAEAIAAANRRA